MSGGAALAGGDAPRGLAPQDNIRIEAVQDRRALKQFIRLPWRIYRGDPNWVPPLLSEMWQTLTTPNNPLFKGGPHQAFLAWREDPGRGGLAAGQRTRPEPVGRILCGINHEMNRVKGSSLGYLSLFECIDDLDVARALFGAAEEWLRGHEATAVHGPASPTQGDDYRGLLVEGFDGPPVLMESYNPPWYPRLFEACGYAKEADLWAFRYDIAAMPERLERVADYAMRRYGFAVSSLRLAALEEDLRDIKQIIDRAMPDDWADLAPPSLADIGAEAQRLRPLADPDLCAVARTSSGEPIGFAVGLPNYNELLRAMNGRLFPLGWLRFLLGRRHVQSVRIFILFVVPEWRKKAVTGVMFAHILRHARRKGYTWGEGSTIGETNEPMVREAEGAGGRHYRTYRFYTKELGPQSGRKVD